MRTVSRSTMLRCPAMPAFAPILTLLLLVSIALGDEPGDYEELCHEGLQDCQEESDQPGCNDANCCKLVCSQDPFCCFGEWDFFCADSASVQCEPPLPCPNGGSCFEIGDPDEPGCDDESCCVLVCGFDSFCCSGYWDETCVELAFASCVAPVCELPPPADDELSEPEECAERINEGCNFFSAEFADIECGDKYRGTAFSGAPRDTDWYRFEVDEPGEYTWTVTSEFPSTVLVISGECQHAIRIIAQGYGGDCTPVSLTFDAELGAYFLFVSPGTPAGPLRSGVRCPPDEEDEDEDPPPPTHFGIEYIAHLSSDLCPPGGIPGDLNGDGVVDGLDLLILLQNWGDCPDPQDCVADLNGDGIVDGLDLLILLQNWGSG